MHNPDTAYREFQATLRRYLARRLDDPGDVDDVLQDVFLRVTRNDRALETADNPLAWLHAVTKSALIDHLRREKKHAAGRSHTDLDDLPAASAGRHVDDFGACLAPLVENLSEKYRRAVRFVDIEGGRQTELAAMSGSSVSAVKSQVQRGRRQLKAAILECCLVERDALDNVTALTPGSRDPDCC